jgi:hypothetical protein
LTETEPDISKPVFARVLDRRVEFQLATPALRALVVANFEAMLDAHPDGDPDLIYSEIHTEFKPSILQARPQLGEREGVCEADVLWSLEKELTIALQKARPDLLFLHSAALAFGDEAYLFVASSGTGKSTTAFALLQHGFRYMSDELSPVDPETLDVHPYPHALCLKRPPPLPYVLPAATIDLNKTLHVPTAALDGAVTESHRHPLGAIFVLERSGEDVRPHATPLQKAEAAARLYTHALNPLAHANLGLDAAVSIVERVPCFHLAVGLLPATCALIRRTVETLVTRESIVAA